MKKFLLLFINCFTAASLFAQEPADALRFSWTVPSGTARQQAVGGAMGSLGGDLSATFMNPAGLALYKTGDLVLSPAYRFGKNKSNYFNRKENEKEKNFILGTTGVVIGSGNGRGRVKNTAFSIGFNTTANFKSNILYNGINNQSSYSQKYIEELTNSGRRDSTITYLFPHGSSLAFNTYWIDPVKNASGNVTGFTSRSPVASGVIQQQNIISRGGIYEPSIAGAANFNDRLLVGGSISVPYLYYNKESIYNEADATTNTTRNFDFATVEEKLNTKGVGFNAKAGLIYKPQEFWRIGVAVHSPTIYSLTDTYSTQITTDTSQTDDRSLSDYSVDYEDGSSISKYTLITPYRIVGSISYVLREIQDVTKQKGFLTADIEYVNYKASSFHPESDEEVVTDQETKDYLQLLNKAVDNAYKSAFNFRVGGELKFTTIMVRLGAAYYGNPYKNINGEKGSKLNLSGGLGYRNKGFFADLTYVHNINKDVHFPYRLQAASYKGATIKSGISNILLTLGWKI